MRVSGNCFPFVAIMLLLVFPTILISFGGYGTKEIYQVSKQLLVSLLFFLIPIVLFYRNIKVYFYLLLPLIVLTPLFLFSTFFFGVPPASN